VMRPKASVAQWLSRVFEQKLREPEF